MCVLRSGGKLIVPAAQAHLFQTRSLQRRKGQSDKARDLGPRKRTYSVLIQYAEEFERAQHSQDGSLRRCARAGVRKMG
jgi:hypothetical protein